MEKKYLSKIIANDNEGLQTISACCAGAEIKVSDIKYLQTNKVFLLPLKRTKIETQNEGKKVNSICKFEFVDNDAALAWYDQLDLPDQRLNHMCKDNHTILADRMYEHITHKCTLDLAYGYNNSFLSIATQDADQLNPSPITIRT